MKPNSLLLTAFAALALAGCAGEFGAPEVARHSFDMSVLERPLSKYKITPVSGLPEAQMSRPKTGERVIVRRMIDGEVRVSRSVITKTRGSTLFWRADDGWSGSSRGSWWFHGNAQAPDGRKKTAKHSGNLDNIFPLQVGKSSTGQTAVIEMDGESYTDAQACFVVAQESVTIQNEAKAAYRVECAHDSSGWVPGDDPSTAWSQQIHWIVPGEGLVLRARMRERGQKLWDISEIARVPDQQ